MLGILDSLTGGEVIMILIVALLVLGPERLPETARTLGKWMSKLRSMTSDLQSEVREVLDDPQMKPIREVGEFVTSPRKKLMEFATQAEAEAETARRLALEATAAAESAEAAAAEARAQAEADAGGEPVDGADDGAGAGTLGESVGQVHELPQSSDQEKAEEVPEDVPDEAGTRAQPGVAEGS